MDMDTDTHHIRPQYVGTVVDRMTGETVYRSRPTSTWGEAQTRAERRAKGARYTVTADAVADTHAAAVALGRLGGKSRSPAKRAAAAANVRTRWAWRAPSWYRGECGAGWGAVVRDPGAARVVTAERYHEPPERIRVWAYASRADAYDGRRGEVL
jgi:hypothetical protein